MQRMRIIVAVLLGGLVASAENWVANPGFEQLDEKGGAADWRWWTREEGAGRVEVTADERHEGERAVRIVHEGEKDFNLANSRRRTVTPGESFKITCRMKRTGDANAGTLNIVGLKGKEVVDWSIGRTRAPRGEGWVLCQGWVVVPEGVDTVYARVVGSGKSDFWVDDVSTIPDTPPMPVKGAKVEGWMTNRPVEIMGR
ncbi:MAG: hypothetical protein FWH21_03595, partial [Kiritimatiellaeota bacterium]|nr:hypothetical protein [Kiritimatiellota bacterium]